MLTQTDSAREARARRAAHRQDLIVSKVREGSRWFYQYGPFMVSDLNNCLVSYGHDLDTLEKYLNG